MRILLAGDTHSHLEHWEYLLHQRALFDCDAVIQLGDFGYYPKVEHLGYYISGLEEMIYQCGLAGTDFRIYFIDGNHDDHASLFKLPRDEDGFAIVSEHIRWIPRGHSFTWDGVKFLGLGGGYSVNRKHMEKVGLYSPHELLIDTEIERAIKVGKVDVLLTHDVPEGINIAEIIGRTRGGDAGFKPHPPSHENRRKLRRVVERCRPRQVFHGHYHAAHRNELRVGDRIVKIEGLAQENKGPRSWTVFDTEEFLERR